MTKLNELKLINDSNILYLKKLKQNSKRNEIIKRILDDEACFFKMNKSDAYLILQDIGILDDEVDNIYKTLISYNEFYRLFKSQKIDLNDTELIIKYPIYNTDDLFKNRKNTTTNSRENLKKDLEIIPYKESFIKKVFNKIIKFFQKQ